MLQGINFGVNIRTPSDEDLDNLYVYEITIPLFWDPTSNIYTENELEMHLAAENR